MKLATKPLERVPDSERRNPAHFSLPWPPSVNHVWQVGKRNNRPTIYRSGKYDAFLNDVRALAYQGKIPAPLRNCEYSISLRCFPPNARRYDLDNRIKATLDALTAVGFWTDDSDVVEIDASKQSIQKGGEIQVVVYSIEKTPAGRVSPNAEP